MKHPFQNMRAAVIGIILGSTALCAQADSYEEGLIAYATGNFKEAGHHLMTAADEGNAGAEHMLMRLFTEGHLTTENPEAELLSWTRKAAEKGNKQAQFALAEIYARKADTMQQAVNWYQQAANQGHPDAYFKLGDILKNGASGISADSAESSRMYQIAASEFLVFAQMGNPEYQFNLGTMYQHAKGVKKDMNIALKWMNKSAMQGHTLAQLTLGRMYANGIDVPRDSLQARYWLEMAAAQGHGDAITALGELNNKSTVAYAM